MQMILVSADLPLQDLDILEQDVEHERVVLHKFGSASGKLNLLISLRVPNFGTYIVRFSIFVRTSGTLFVSK